MLPNTKLNKYLNIKAGYYSNDLLLEEMYFDYQKISEH
jgi:hypothetical protein